MPIQHQLLAYISDYGLLRTATLPHRNELSSGNTFFASLDHALWFHRDFSFDKWLLYSTDSPSASNARGFARGSIYDQRGFLIASSAQEGFDSNQSEEQDVYATAISDQPPSRWPAMADQDEADYPGGSDGEAPEMIATSMETMPAMVMMKKRAP